MKRDMDLIRVLLLQADEGKELPSGKYTPEQVDYHRWLLVDAGFAAADSEKLTRAGLTFLDAIRDDDVWQKMKDRAESLGSIPVSILIEASLKRSAIS